MNRTAAVAALALALTLTGCAQTAPETPTTPKTTPTATQAAPEQTPEPDYCDILTNGLQRYTDFIADIAAGALDMPTYYWVTDWADDLAAAVPEDGKTQLNDLLSPIDPISEIAKNGGGDLEISTDDFKQGAQTTLEYCAEN